MPTCLFVIPLYGTTNGNCKIFRIFIKCDDRFFKVIKEMRIVYPHKMYLSIFYPCVNRETDESIIRGVIILIWILKQNNNRNWINVTRMPANNFNCCPWPFAFVDLQRLPFSHKHKLKKHIRLVLIVCTV